MARSTGRLLPALTVAAIVLAGIVSAQEAQFLTSDTDFEIGAVDVTPQEVTIHGNGDYETDGSLTLPGFVEVDALHKLPYPGQWLFSVKNGLSATDSVSPDPLAQMVGQSIFPNDIVRSDGDGSFTLFFSGQQIPQPLSSGANLDALYMDGEDLVISLDAGIPTDLVISGLNVEQADLIRYTRSSPGATGPTDWSLVGLEFDATGRLPGSSNVIGASRSGDYLVLSFKIDTDVTPDTAGINPYLPGNLAKWGPCTPDCNNPAGTFLPFELLDDWPAEYFVNSLALVRTDTCPNLAAGANPADGEIDLCGVTWLTDGGDRKVSMEWRVENGASRYNVYSGSLGSIASPLPLGCETSGGVAGTQFEIADVPDAQFYLVAGIFSGIEGTLGDDGDGVQRINGGTACP